MGQYLSAPITEKEGAEGYNDALGYGLATMQGWRVSMEDAHITELELEPVTKTALFSIFDGHGGKAVAIFCAKYLAKELINTPAYKRGDLRQAIVDAYYRLDVILDSEEGRAELRELVGPSTKRAPQGLFMGLEEGLTVSTAEDRTVGPAASESAETEPLGRSSGSSSPRTKPGGKMLQKKASEQFVASHLMRASVIPVASPMAADGEGNANGVVGGKEGAGGDEGDEEHHAAGMGCTAVSVLVRGDNVVVANTGDSRCVLSRKGQAIALTLDHKPILFEEARRIIKAGGFVRDNRINGALNVSRTIGDLDFKRNLELPPSEQMVVATPDIEAFTLRDGDEFIILACDGIWDVMSNQEAVDFVRRRMKQGQSLQSVCESMCDACLAPDLKGLCRGADNMSVIILLFRKHASLGGWWNKLFTSMCNFPSNSPLAKKR